MRRAEQDDRGGMAASGARARTPGKLPVLPVLREDRLGWEPGEWGFDTGTSPRKPIAVHAKLRASIAQTAFRELKMFRESKPVLGHLPGRDAAFQVAHRTQQRGSDAWLSPAQRPHGFGEPKPPRGMSSWGQKRAVAPRTPGVVFLARSTPLNALALPSEQDVTLLEDRGIRFHHGPVLASSGALGFVSMQRTVSTRTVELYSIVVSDREGISHMVTLDLRQELRRKGALAGDLVPFSYPFEELKAFDEQGAWVKTLLLHGRPVSWTPELYSASLHVLKANRFDLALAAPGKRHSLQSANSRGVAGGATSHSRLIAEMRYFLDKGDNESAEEVFMTEIRQALSAMSFRRGAPRPHPTTARISSSSAATPRGSDALATSRPARHPPSLSPSPSLPSPSPSLPSPSLPLSLSLTHRQNTGKSSLNNSSLSVGTATRGEIGKSSESSSPWPGSPSHTGGPVTTAISISGKEDGGGTPQSHVSFLGKGDVTGLRHMGDVTGLRQGDVPSPARRILSVDVLLSREGSVEDRTGINGSNGLTPKVASTPMSTRRGTRTAADPQGLVQVSLELLFRQYSASQRITIRSVEEALDDIDFFGESQICEYLTREDVRGLFPPNVRGICADDFLQLLARARDVTVLRQGHVTRFDAHVGQTIALLRRMHCDVAQACIEDVLSCTGDLVTSLLGKLDEPEKLRVSLLAQSEGVQHLISEQETLERNTFVGSQAPLPETLEALHEQHSVLSSQLGHPLTTNNVPFLSVALAEIHRRAAVVADLTEDTTEALHAVVLLHVHAAQEAAQDAVAAMLALDPQTARRQVAAALASKDAFVKDVTRLASAVVSVLAAETPEISSGFRLNGEVSFRQTASWDEERDGGMLLVLADEKVEGRLRECNLVGTISEMHSLYTTWTLEERERTTEAAMVLCALETVCDRLLSGADALDRAHILIFTQANPHPIGEDPEDSPAGNSSRPASQNAEFPGSSDGVSPTLELEAALAVLHKVLAEEAFERVESKILSLKDATTNLDSAFRSLLVGDDETALAKVAAAAEVAREGGVDSYPAYRKIHTQRAAQAESVSAAMREMRKVCMILSGVSTPEIFVELKGVLSVEMIDQMKQFLLKANITSGWRLSSEPVRSLIRLAEETGHHFVTQIIFFANASKEAKNAAGPDSVQQFVWGLMATDVETLEQHLLLNDNAIHDLPADMFETSLALLRVVSLNLSACKIQSLPVTIQELKHLQRLALDENQMTALPAALGLLADTLTELTVHGNLLLESPPREVLDQGGAAAVQYLKSVFQNGTENKRMQLILVGVGEAGKTSTLRAIINEDTDQAGAIGIDDRTVGLNSQIWTPRAKYADGISFEILDIGGQQIYASLSQFFLSRRAQYGLVWRLHDLRAYGKDSDDLRSAMAQISDTVTHFLHNLQLRVPGASVVLLVTHMDCTSTEDADRQIAAVQRVTRGVLVRMADSIQTQARAGNKKVGLHPLQVHDNGRSLKMNCLSGEGVPEARKAVVEASKKLATFGDMVPSALIDLRKRLASLLDHRMRHTTASKKTAPRTTAPRTLLEAMAPRGPPIRPACRPRRPG